MRSGILAKSHQVRSLHTAIGKLTTPPKCAAWLFVKARRRSVSKQQVHSKVRDTPGGLKKNTLLPGQEVSVNHFICSTLGRLYTGYRKTEDSRLDLREGVYSSTTHLAGFTLNTNRILPLTKPLVQRNNSNLPAETMALSSKNISPTMKQPLRATNSPTTYGDSSRR
jgi:hypothetical protein